MTRIMNAMQAMIKVMTVMISLRTIATWRSIMILRPRLMIRMKTIVIVVALPSSWLLP